MSTFSTIFRLALFIAVSIAVTFPAASDQGAGEIVIISIVGHWAYNGKPVAFGTPLPAGEGFLYGLDGSVVLKSDNKLQAFACEKLPPNSDRCTVPLDPAEWKSTGEGFGNLWAAVKRLITGDPEKYMVAASRGVEPGLVDAVVPLQGRNLDLYSAFGEMSAGEYWIKLEPITGTAIINKSLELRFVPHTPTILAASAIHPGLYRLLLVDKTGAPTGSDCWILASPPEDYPSVSQAFQQAVLRSAKWPEDMDPSAIRALLRAYLESLSISGPKSNP